MNEVINVINQRISLRKYADKPVTQEEVDTIIHSAMRAPTAGNMMLYSVLNITDQTIKDRLVVTCDNQPFIAKAPLVLIFVADYQRWYDYFYASDVDVTISPNEADLMLATLDAMCAAENAVIAAESLGIGSCYIGDIMENYEIHQEMLNLPDWVFPVGMLCFGHYPEKLPRTPRDRFGKEYIVFENQYRRLSEEELKAMFAEKEAAYNKRPRETSFAEAFYDRKVNSDFSHEMRRSVKAALEKWK